MFDSRALDRLSRVHPIVPPLIFVPAIAVLFALGQEGIAPLPVIAWLIGGYVFWTLTEYWLHRLVFHFEPEQGIGARLHWIIHGVHHDHPNDPMRLVMPPSVSVPLALALLRAVPLVLGAQHADLLACGFLAGYLAYDMPHYHLHHHRPRRGWASCLRAAHAPPLPGRHRGFGVSAPVLGPRVRYRRAPRTPALTEPFWRKSTRWRNFGAHPTGVRNVAPGPRRSHSSGLLDFAGTARSFPDLPAFREGVLPGPRRARSMPTWSATTTRSTPATDGRWSCWTSPSASSTTSRRRCPAWPTITRLS